MPSTEVDHVSSIDFRRAFPLVLDGLPVEPGAAGRQSPPAAEVRHRVGSLYYVREAPTASLAKPAYLEALCTTDPTKYGIRVAGPFDTGDIDFSNRLDLSGSLSGLDAKVVSAGLEGKFTDYYEFKLTNAKRLEITGVDADRLFENRGFQRDCVGWRNAIAKQGWAAYQIVSITYGDLSFGPRRTLSLSPEVSAKLASLTPSLETTVATTTQLRTSGKGLVVSFTPIGRN